MEKDLSLDQLIDAVKQELKPFNLEGLLKFKNSIELYINGLAKDRIQALKNQANDLKKQANTLETDVLNLSDKFGIKA